MMATLDNDDLEAIRDLIGVVIDEKDLVSRSDISHLPTKEEFYAENAKLMKELETIRQQEPIMQDQLSDHEDRISVLENKFQD